MQVRMMKHSGDLGSGFGAAREQFITSDVSGVRLDHLGMDNDRLPVCAAACWSCVDAVYEQEHMKPGCTSLQDTTKMFVYFVIQMYSYRASTLLRV
jgi:hypothetical protein